MLILGDETRHRGVPWVTISLVLMNLVVFSLQLTLGERFTRGFSLVPAEITTGRDLTKPTAMKIKERYRDRYPGRDYGKVRYRDTVVMVPQAPGPRPVHLTLFTSMFMHGGWLHLIGNMWFLIVFGRNVELAMRHGLFLAFYLTCGVFAGLADVLVGPGSVIPCLGASGAISGVMGAYFFIYPLNKVKCWFGLYWGVIELPSVVVVGGWFLIQYLNTAAAFSTGQVHTGVAYWSHVGGFLTGIAFILVTLAILKYQQQQEEAAALESEGLEQTPAEREADRLFARPEEPTPDPFQNFLPPEREAFDARDPTARRGAGVPTSAVRERIE